jgi:hypothetical protein
LKTYQSNHRGMAMFAAIAFLLVMATIAALMVSMTTLTSKRGTDLYFQEQAHLLAKSATEYALLAISGHSIASTGNCINTINATYGDIYDINTTIRYIGNGFPTIAGACDMLKYANGINDVNDIQTAESNGTVIIDVYVTAPSDQTGAERVRFHRRTMQKP